jgi:HAD superfamily hydrolase (TIGR01509 family)
VAAFSDRPLLIFDCDGVLVDSEYLFAQVASECLSTIGIAITAEDAARRFAGVSIKDMLAELERDAGQSFPVGFADLLVRREDEAYRQQLRSIPGVREAVLALELPRCVASSSLPERVAGSLVVTGLDDLFPDQARFSTVLVPRGKPAPDIFLLAAERMGAKPEGSIVVEDSLAGVTGAVAAGMRVIGFTGGRHCGEGHAARLESAGAHRVIAEMKLLPETVQGLMPDADRWRS